MFTDPRAVCPLYAAHILQRGKVVRFQGAIATSLEYGSSGFFL
jgi:glycine/D-amino acid oxidase-like deaminating enzyme